MKIIQPANSRVKALLRPPNQMEGQSFRPIRYLLREETSDGILLFNTLTCEMLLLSSEEEKDVCKSEELAQRCFTVPEGYDEQGHLEQIRKLLRIMRSKRNDISSFTILTTSDCNARCYYCFEQGYRKPMSDQVALETAGYIIQKHQDPDKEVHLRWFGGEPLFHQAPIDLITQTLKEQGIPYYSTMITNGYLADDTVIEKMTGPWKLRTVQITLDGPENTYNSTKAYIYENITSPYRRVISNISCMAEAGIQVNLRLNLGFENGNELELLTDELLSRYAGQKNIKASCALLYDDEKAFDDPRWPRMILSHERIQEKLSPLGSREARADKLPRGPLLYNCGTTEGSCPVIAPDGRITACEHYYDREVIGSIRSDETDLSVLSTWHEILPPLPICRLCPIAPQCCMTPKCVSSFCYPEKQRQRETQLRRAMLAKWEAMSQNETK